MPDVVNVVSVPPFVKVIVGSARFETLLVVKKRFSSVADPKPLIVNVDVVAVLEPELRNR
jgi:hypothetical protein